MGRLLKDKIKMKTLLLKFFLLVDIVIIFYVADSSFDMKNKVCKPFLNVFLYGFHNEISNYWK